MDFPKHIFKAYDIRGLVDGELSEDLAYRIGRAFVRVLSVETEDIQGKTFVVGRDMRETSPTFAREVMRGITDEGVNVVDIGLTTTPVFNFTCADDPRFAGGIMVTASHNPAQYNGFKLTRADGLPVGEGTGMEALREMVQENAFGEGAAQPGTLSEEDVRDAYIEKLFSLVDTTALKPLKVVIDGGNGMGKIIFPKWLERLPVEVEYLYMEPDGTFPNHEANPLKKETLKDLQARVQEVGADFGFALDGDADRVGLVDERGRVVPASFVSALLGLEYLKTNPGIHMLYDLRSSQMHKDLWEAQGATTELCMVGHARIKNMMREVDAAFASELSLHLFFGDMHNLESTDRCLLLLLSILSKENKPLSEVLSALDQGYAHSGEINFEVEDKDETLKRVREAFQDEAKEDITLDGVWLGFDWGWMNLRKSNTEPVIRLNVETKDAALTEEKIAAVKELIEQKI